MTGSCRVCGSRASQVCGGCRKAAYCSREHQTEDWAAGHKAECGPPFRVESDPRLGRHLVATRRIAPGETLLRERPLVLGPKMRSFPVCLGCHAELTREGHVKCPGCTWPLCSAACSAGPRHQRECALMSARGFVSRTEVGEKPKREVAYCVITPLRCLLLDPADRKTLFDLESHVEVRSQTELYSVFKANLVPFVTKVLGLPFDEQTIMKVAGILDTNCFEVNSGRGAKVRGLYAKGAMFAHDCRANTKHHFTAEDELVVVATRAISKGEVMSVTYTQSLWGTGVRREHLLGSKCFLCTCTRCSDPTELGTYLGALRCVRCKEGYVTSLEPLDSESGWRCGKCGQRSSHEKVCSAHVQLQRQLQLVDKSHPHPMEQLILKLSQAPNVHRNLYELLQVKYALCQIYSKFSSDLTDQQMENWYRMSKDLLQVANVLEPGQSRLRGELLFDMQATKLHSLRAKLNAGLINRTKAQEELKKTFQILGEASTILKTEPDLYPLVETQFQNLKNFSNFLISS